MASSKALTAHPIRTFLLSVLVFLALDAAIFRSGLYNRVISPESVPGKFYWTTHYEQARKADPSRDVMVLGNSKIEFGLSVREIETQHFADGYHFIMGGSPATQMKWWYYELRQVDPRRDRYRAVVIPVNGYLVRPEADILKVYADYASAVAIAPFLSMGDWKEFDASIEDPEVKRKLTFLQWFAARKYSSDVADIIARSGFRVRLLLERAKIGDRWMYGGKSIGNDSIASLRFDYRTGDVTHWPDYFDASRHIETVMYTHPSADPVKATQQTLRYNRYWLNRIIDLYRGTQTRVVLLPVPAYGVPMAGIDPIAGAPDIRSALDSHNANIVALDEAPFKALQQPELFYDTLHLNTRGREQFSKVFAEQFVRSMAGQ